jgi:hypothetical protein
MDQHIKPPRNHFLRSDEGDTLERRSVDVEPNSGGPNALRMPLRKTHKTDGRPPFECIALLLQGGGTLGAYQAGVYEALVEAHIHPDWGRRHLDRSAVASSLQAQRLWSRIRLEAEEA